jgi:UDP:flavonoid glycosyltransferase YjiC (YdhE family)
LPEKAVLAGPLLWEPAPADPSIAQWCEDESERGAGLIYFTVDKLFANRDFVDDVLDAADGLGMRVAAALGPLASAHPRQGRKFLIRPHLTQSVVLAKASIAVSTGHTNAVVAAACAGVPQLVIDLGSGATEAAANCRHAGIGLGVPVGRISRRSVEVALRWFSDQVSIRRRAAELAKSFSAADSFARCAEVIEALAAGGCASRQLGRAA